MSARWVPNCRTSARARFGFLFGSILSTCPESHVQRLFSSIRVTSMALIAALSFPPTLMTATAPLMTRLSLSHTVVVETKRQLSGFRFSNFLLTSIK